MLHAVDTVYIMQELKVLWPAVDDEFLSREQSVLTFDGANPSLLTDTQYFRKLLSRETDPPLDLICSRSKLVTRLCDLIVPGVPVEVRFEAAWAVCNICSGTPEHCAAAMANGAHGRFIQALSEPCSIKLKDQCVWGLGNIAGDGPHARDICIEMSAIESVLACFPHFVNTAGSVNSSFLRNATWALCNFFRGANPPGFGQRVQGAMQCMLNVLKDAFGLAQGYWATISPNHDEEVQMDALWCIKYLLDEVNSDGLARVKKLLQLSPNFNWLEAALCSSNHNMLNPVRIIVKTVLSQQSLQAHTGASQMSDVLLERLGLSVSCEANCKPLSQVAAVRKMDTDIMAMLADLLPVNKVLRQKLLASPGFAVGVQARTLGSFASAEGTVQFVAALLQSCSEDEIVQCLQLQPSPVDSAITAARSQLSGGTPVVLEPIMLAVHRTCTCKSEHATKAKQALARSSSSAWLGWDACAKWLEQLDAGDVPSLHAMCKLMNTLPRDAQDPAIVPGYGVVVKASRPPRQGGHDDDNAGPAGPMAAASANSAPHEMSMQDVALPAAALGPANDSGSDSGDEEPGV